MTKATQTQLKNLKTPGIEMIEHLSEVAMSLTAPFIIGVFTFLWRMNTKMSTFEARLEAHDRRIVSNANKLHTHFEKSFTIRKDRQ